MYISLSCAKPPTTTEEDCTFVFELFVLISKYLYCRIRMNKDNPEILKPIIVFLFN